MADKTLSTSEADEVGYVPGDGWWLLAVAAPTAFILLAIVLDLIGGSFANSPVPDWAHVVNRAGGDDLERLAVGDAGNSESLRQVARCSHDDGGHMERLENSRWGFESNCFVCETASSDGLGIEFFADIDDGAVFADFTLDQRFSGAPSYVHGRGHRWRRRPVRHGVGDLRPARAGRPGGSWGLTSSGRQMGW